MSQPVIGLLGLPGAGKTTALDFLDERVDYNFETLQMKSVANAEFQRIPDEGMSMFPERMQDSFYDRGLDERIVLESATEDKLGDWVDAVLSVNDEYFAKRAVDRADELSGVDFVAVDGIRSFPDAKYFQKAASELELVYIHTPFSVRLERLSDRGRKGETDIGPEYLVERDNQELSWGVDRILTEYDVSYFYNNYDSIAEFWVAFDDFVDELLDIR